MHGDLGPALGWHLVSVLELLSTEGEVCLFVFGGRELYHIRAQLDVAVGLDRLRWGRHTDAELLVEDDAVVGEVEDACRPALLREPEGVLRRVPGRRSRHQVEGADGQGPVLELHRANLECAADLVPHQALGLLYRICAVADQQATWLQVAKTGATMAYGHRPRGHVGDVDIVDGGKDDGVDGFHLCMYIARYFFYPPLISMLVLKSNIEHPTLLDDLPSSVRPNAIGGFSLRLLSQTYTGPVVRLRRSTDNATLDFYASTSGVLGTNPGGTGTSPETWLGGAIGYVRTWYDQTGNTLHATQTTNANQPIIAKTTYAYVVRFNASSSQFLNYDGSGNASVWNGANYSFCVKEQRASSANNTYFLGTVYYGGVTTNRVLHIGYRTNLAFTHAQYANDYDYVVPGYTGSSTTEPVRRWIITHHNSDNPGKRMYLNGTQVASRANNTPMDVPGTTTIGVGDGTYYTGDIHEVVMFNASLPVSAVSAISIIDKSQQLAGRVNRAIVSTTAAKSIVAAPDVRKFAGIPTSLFSGCTGAFSVRRLFSTYNGPVLRVRRDTDNALADVWMDFDGLIERVVETTLDDGATSGGAVTYNKGYRIHTFTSNGTLTVNAPRVVDLLVVGGGGGGGTGAGFVPGGGGGGGGVIYWRNYMVNGTTTVTVGNGGTESQPGQSSSFGALLASGGGAGGSVVPGAAARFGGNGGSGGGGARADVGGFAIRTTSNFYGTNGGAGNTGTDTLYGGGGGGGATTAGGDNVGRSGGNGGEGLLCAISGSKAVYGSGGGGGQRQGSAGTGGTNAGTGGNPGQSAINGFGGGGGGGTIDGTNNILGGQGGSGIVIARVLRHPGIMGRNALNSWLNGSTATVVTWYDQSESGNDATDIRGNPRLSSYPSDPYLFGTFTDGLRFPAALLPSTYSLFHVAQYKSDYLEYPPAALPGGLINNGPTTLNGQLYGNGSYDFNATSNYTNRFTINAFKKTVLLGAVWISANGTYDTSGNVVTGTSEQTTNGITGQHIQIQLPYGIQLGRYAVQCNGATTEYPKEWYLFGSVDGTNWVQLHYVLLSDTPSNNNTFDLSTNTVFYSYYRIVVTKMVPNGVTRVQIGEWRLYATPQAKRILDGVTADWASGFLGSRAGVASHAIVTTNASPANGSVVTSIGGATGFGVGGNLGPILDRSTAIPHITFNGTSNSVGDYLNFGSTTWNVNTNGGFAFVGMVRFKNTSGSYERIFEFSSVAASPVNCLAGARVSTTNTITFGVGDASASYNTNVSNAIVNNTWQVIVARLQNEGTNLWRWTIWVDNVRTNGTQFLTTLSDRTLPISYVGRSGYSTDAYAQLDIRELLWYNQALTDGQISMMHDYLVNKYTTNSAPWIPPPITPYLSIQPYHLIQATPSPFLASDPASGSLVSSIGGATGYGVGGSPGPLVDRTTGIPHINLKGQSGSVGDYFDLGSRTFNLATNGGFTFVGMVRFNSYNPGGAGTERVFDFGNGAGVNNIIMYRGSPSQIIFTTYSSNQKFVITNGVVDGTWHILACRVVNTGTNLWAHTVWIDGTATTVSNQSITLADVTLSGCYIGKSWWDGNGYCDMSIREMMWYNRALADGEVSLLNTYLTNKYNRSTSPWAMTPPITPYLSISINSLLADAHASGLTVSVDQNTPNLYRSNGVLRTSTATNSSTSQLSINHGASADYSDWIAKEVLVFNNTVALPNVLSIERNLLKRYLGVLDQVTPTTKAACYNALSLRLLTSTYTGPCVQVRRSTDNVQRDFYANMLGELGTEYLAGGQNLQEWLKGTTGYVVTWYDQTGNGKHASQATTSLQPFIRYNRSLASFELVQSNTQNDVLASALTATVVPQWTVVYRAVYGMTQNSKTDSLVFNTTTVTANDLALVVPRSGAVMTSNQTITYNSVLEAGEAMARVAFVTNNLQASGGITINGQNMNMYDCVFKSGNHTVSSGFTVSDWFTSVQDTRSAWITVNGNLTINSGTTFTPSVRKLFTVIYVRGNLTVNGSISMTARGANHNGTGESGFTSVFNAREIRIATGNYNGIVDPKVPATGGAGAGTSAYAPGLPGSNGIDGATGGGGSGGTGGSPGSSSFGADGTSFSGGASGGAVGSTVVPSVAEPNGGAGGYSNAGVPGVGNPSGGTAGILMVICTGQLSGSGSVVANGTNGVPSGYWGSGGGGGGSVSVMYGSESGTVTVSATGGIGGAGTRSGGNGGDGTARKVPLIVKYPPIALASANMLVTGQDYGNGTYVVTSSSQYSTGEANYMAFDTIINTAATSNNMWTISTPTYYDASGNYSGPNSTTINGVTYLGEWLQFVCPTAFTLKRYQLYTWMKSLDRGPKDFKLAASNDGTTWTEIESRTNITSWTSSGFTYELPLNITPYSTYRVCVNKNNGGGWLSLSEVNYFGV
jgi:hypothetical protein